MTMPGELTPSEDARFEQISIPTNGSFLWRCDDYPWERNVWNYHPEIEIHLVRKTSGVSYVGDYIGHFEPGNLCMVGGNLPHNWVTIPDPADVVSSRDIVLQFHPDTFLSPKADMPEFRELEDLFERAALGIEFTGNTAIKGAEILEEMGSAEGLKRMSIMLDLLSLLARSDETKIMASHYFAYQDKRAKDGDLKLLETALTYLQDNYLSNPKIGEVAETVGMSESVFSRFFKKQTGNTYTEHLTTLRLYTAKKLLRETDISITDLCYEAGFSNISNFNRTFLRHTGLRPFDYRKVAKQRV